jgi:hypothetical protein
MTPTLPLHKGALLLDHSGFFSPKMECDQKLAYQFLHKRVKAEEPVATSFGTCIHSVLEYRYKIHGTAKIDEAGRATMQGITQRHFDAHPSPFGDRRNLAFAEEITTRYLEKYPTEEFQLLEFEEAKPCQHCPGDGIVFSGIRGGQVVEELCVYCGGTGLTKAMVELPFVVPLYTHILTEAEKQGWMKQQQAGLALFPVEIPVYYIGKIDLPLLRNGQLYVMDHKTTSVLDKNFFYAKKASQQTKMYCYAMQALTGMKVDGYAINVIHTQEVPKYLSNIGMSELADAFRGKPKKLRQYKHPNLKSYWDEALTRQFHAVTQEELLAAKDNAINLCEEFFWNYSRGIFPMSSSDTVCVSKYGMCPFYTVCHEVAQADKLDYLASGAYMDADWTPLNKITE